MENDTGLEYIGTSRQQMGDGGLIAQFRGAESDEFVGATDSEMRCLVVHCAPLDRSCAADGNPVAGQGACAFEESDFPEGWTETGYDDSAWAAAVEHSEHDVSPRDGYEIIEWDRSARLVWSEDLAQDNTLLCRVTIGG